MISAQRRDEIRGALSRFPDGNLAENARSLLSVLGYKSDRTLKIEPNTAERFTEMFNSYGQLNPEKALLHEWDTLDFLFQITDDELSKGIGRDTKLGPGDTFEPSIYQSYLYLAVKLRGKAYNRTALAHITREINKVFAMPALLIFQHGSSLTFASIHRRPGRRESGRDVLEKVSFIKDIDVVSPHRAHVELLAELSLAPLYRAHKFSNFLELHQAWQKTLDISVLNRRFYKEIADWYFWAVDKVRFPADAGEDVAVRNATCVIRLITRLIFVGFLKEKGLVLPEFCDENELEQLLSRIERRPRACREKQSQRVLVHILDRYKFTIAENTPLEEVVALDPEVLGRIFENLLATAHPEAGITTRKQTGSFYTPREIVDFMVEESLIAYFKNALGENSDIDTRLRHLFAYRDRPHRFTDWETARLIQKIDSLKILDPGCGSGAFPMGILHTLVFLLGKLDPRNTQWRQLQSANIQKSEREEVFERNAPDYSRKFYLIKNCIYGVDIQPMAIEIAKFRLFLSLIAELGENREMPALPELKTHFFCADTLLGRTTEPCRLPKFDIVIGNPPYAKGEHLSSMLREQLKQHYGWVGDLCDYFIFAGFDLVAEKGILSYIANDSYVALSKKRPIRDLLLENRLIHLVKVPAQTFDAAIYTAIFVLLKDAVGGSHASYMSGELHFPDFRYQSRGKVDYATIRQMPDQKLLLSGRNVWVLRLLTFDAIEKFCRILDTGISSGNVRKKLFFKEDNGGRHRLLQGRQIQRFSVQWDSPKAQYRFCEIDYEPLPIPGIGRGGKPSRRNEYWGFGGPIENHHQPERLLMRQTDDDLIVAYHSEAESGRFYTDNTLYTILPKLPRVNLKYFLALFNSRLLNFVYHFVSQEAGKSQAQVKVAVVRKLPAVVPAEEAQRPIVALVDKILSAKAANPDADTSELAKEIDRHVYALYGLTAGEISIVEQQS